MSAKALTQNQCLVLHEHWPNNCCLCEKKIRNWKIKIRKFILFNFHKHIWIEESRERLYRDNRYNNFAGQAHKDAPPTPVTIITSKCISCLRRKQQELKGWLGEKFDA